jgi:hypothetical protein
MMSQLINRWAAPRVQDLLGSFRVVILGGARQTGKTTLARDLLNLSRRAWYSFDDAAVAARATEDPLGFVDSLPIPSAIDEFQRAGTSFLLAVKQRADRDRTRGQLLLTGSTNYAANRSTTETLAGRAGRLMLWPLSAGECRGIRETFLDRLFTPEAWPPPVAEALDRSELVETILAGGFPEVVLERLSARQRRDWFTAYVHDVVSREALRPLAEVRLEAELRRLLRLAAARTGGTFVLSDIAADAELGRETAANYLSLLEALHLLVLIPAWSTSVTTRAKRRPKVAVVDTGLAADLTGVGRAAFGPTADGTTAGALFETFVATEVLKQASWSNRGVDISHLQDRNGHEVDLIVEDRRSGEVAALEVKFTATPTSRQARHLAYLRDRLGDRFRLGLLIHTGRHTLPMGDRVWAVPVAALWRSD